MKKFLIFVAAGLILSAGPGGRLFAAEKVTLQLRWDHQFQFAGYYAAKWQGFYDEVGLDVEIRSAVTHTGIRSAVKEVGEGRADFGIGAVDVLKAIDKGIPVILVASIFQHSAAAFYSRTDTLMRQPADFLGLKVARRVNDLIDVELQALLKAEGIDPQKITPYPHQPGIDHLVSKKVDIIPGYSITIPYTAKRKGITVNSFRPINYGIDFYGDSIFTHQRLVQENPDMVTRFKKASLQGWAYALNNPDQIITRIVNDLSRVKTVDNLLEFNESQHAGLHALIHYPEVELGHMNPARWERMHQHLLELGLVENSVVIDKLIFDPERQRRISMEKRQKILSGVVLTVLIVLGAVFFWVRLLRGAVQTKTAELRNINLLLAKSEKKYRELVELAQEGIWVIDADNNTLFANPSMAAMLGYSPEEMQGQSLFAFVDAADVAISQKNLERLRQGVREQQDLELLHKKGHPIYVTMETAPIRDEQGNYAGAIAGVMDTSSRRQMEEALKASRERFQLAMDAARDGLFDWNLVTNEIYYSPGWKRILGYADNELPNDFSVWEQLTDPEDVKRSWQMQQELVAGKRDRFEMEFKMRHKAGHWVDIFSRAQAVYNASGKAVRIVGTHVDITERKLNERRILEKETALRLSLDAAKAGTWVWDVRSGEVIWDDRMQRIFGLEPGTFDGSFDAWKARVHPEDLPGAERATLRALKRGERYTHDYRVKGRDGSWRNVNAQAATLPDESGKPILMSGFALDITERKLAAAALRREADLNKAIAEISKELLSEVYDITRVSTVTLQYAREMTGSAHGFVSSIDKTTLETVGHTLTDMHGEQCRMEDQRTVFPIGPDGHYGALWGHALNTRKSFFTNQPGAHPSANGLPAGHIPLENYLAVPVLIDNTVSGLIALANADRDYTDSDIDTVERLADIFAFALHRNRYELEKQAMEKQLQQMQKLEAIGTLAGEIAHDFNNILFPIVGMSEILLEDLPPDSQEWDNADEIHRAGQRGSELVKQILAFSRQTEHQIMPLRAQTVLKEVVKLIRATIPTDITIIQHIQDDCGMVMADPTQLHQVVMNLLTNAYHALEEHAGGKIEVHLVETTVDEAMLPDTHLNPGKYVKMTISDTGAGIDPVMVEKIFEPYFTTKPQGKGTGLGLAVVHGIVREYNGEIQVDSTPGRGSDFHIYLPLLKREQEDVEAVQTDGFEFGTGHILLVDDEIAIVNLEKQILERLGYRVTTHLNSLEALEAFRANPKAYDLLITDMTMPYMTGDQLSRELMAIRPDLPIIICTGFSERINPEIAREIGIKGYLLKPVVKSKMARLVHEVLAEKGVR